MGIQKTCRASACPIGGLMRDETEIKLVCNPYLGVVLVSVVTGFLLCFFLPFALVAVVFLSSAGFLSSAANVSVAVAARKERANSVVINFFISESPRFFLA